MTISSLRGEHLALLGVLWPGPRSPLSPLLPPGDPEEQERVRAMLGRAGLVDSRGSVIPAMHAAMEVLATASRAVMAEFMRPDQVCMVSHFFSQNAGRSFTLVLDADNNGKGFCGISLPDLLAFCDAGDQASNPAAAPFDLMLDFAEAQVLAAMLDAERTSAIQAITDTTDPAGLSIIPSVLTKPALAERLAAASEKPGEGIFLGLLNSSLREGQPDTAASVDADLSDLLNRTLIRESGSGFGLSESLLPVARRAVFSDMAVTFSIRGSADSGPAYTESGYCIRADGMLFWCISRSDTPDRVYLKYHPSDRLAPVLQCLFVDPSCSLTRRTTPEIQKPEQRLCPQCGGYLTEGKQFCGTCGARIG